MTSILFSSTVILGAALPFCIKSLELQKISYGEIVLWCSILVIFLTIAFLRKKTTRYQDLFSRNSLLRMVIGGAALSLSTYAYESLGVTEVNLVARLDLPIFLLLSGSLKNRKLAIAIIIVGLCYTFFTMSPSHVSGLSAIWAATGLTAFGYWCTRNAAKTDDWVILIAPPYIGAALYSMAILQGFPTPPSRGASLILVTTGIAIGLCVLSAQLFKRAKMGTAELTGCVALLATYFSERFFLDVPPSSVVGIAAVLSVALGSIMIFQEEIGKWLKIKV